MKQKIYCFSSTGNSLYVAKKISENLDNCEVVSIVKANENKEFSIEADVIGFVYPIHVGSFPIVVEEFLKKIDIKGNPYIFAIGVTGGGEAKMSFKHINSILGEKNKLSSFFTLKYISNYIRAGRNAESSRADKAFEDNEPKISDIVSSIKDKEIYPIGNLVGITLTFYNFWKNVRKRDKKFNVNEECISCEICKRVCPSSNIILENSRPKWMGNCSDCMACINLCPKNAINIGTSTIKKQRYKNKKVNVQELFVR